MHYRLPRRFRRPFPVAREKPGRPAPFRSDEELLDAARRMLLARNAPFPDERQGPESEEKDSTAEAWTRFWHESVALTGNEVAFVERLRPLGLETLDWEIAASLVIDRLGFLEESVDTVIELLGFLGARDLFQALGRLGREGPLPAAGMVRILDPSEDPGQRRVEAAPALVEPILKKLGAAQTAFAFDSEEDFRKRLRPLVKAFRSKLPDHAARLSFPPRARGGSPRPWNLFRDIETALEKHPEWATVRFLSEEDFSGGEKAVLMILLGRELGHLPADDMLFTGLGLAKATREDGLEEDGDMEEDEESGEILGAGHPLVRGGWVRPAAGAAVLIGGNPEDLEDVEFELSDASLDRFGIERKRLKKRSGDRRLEFPEEGLDRLVLHDDVTRSLDLSLDRARNQERFFRDWGLGKVVPYGRAVTLLFSGPPGVGKTAAARALAFELGRPLLVVDYAEVQNCFVGQTEKNIVRAFRGARRSGAVLFWDEADAMFHDREAASRPFESRHVNVLLQELERFEGVCVLATNRKIVLDRALARRIAVKVEFRSPDRGMRRRIWGLLLPPELPLDDDVDLDRLAGADLTGGEIKNAVVNAAGFASVRGAARVAMADFHAALRLEAEEERGSTYEGSIGFHGPWRKPRESV